MSIKIEPGQDYLLDGKIVVKVLKAVNRSLTIFNIESQHGVESVEAGRLKPLGETSLTLEAGLENFPGKQVINNISDRKS